MFGDDTSVFSLLATLDDYSRLPQIHFPHREMDAGTWFAVLKEHPHVIAIQLLKDGERQVGYIWTRESLSTIEMLKALGM